MSNESQPQIRHPGSPQTYPLPESSTMSPVNPAVSRLANPPLPTQPLFVQPSKGNDVTPQRQISAVSQLSAIPPTDVPQTNEPGLRVLSVGDGNVVSGAVVPPTPSPQITPERQTTPENHVQENKAAPVESLINRVAHQSQSSPPPQNTQAIRSPPMEQPKPVAPVEAQREAITSPHESHREGDAIITPPSPIDDDGTYKLSPPPVPADGNGEGSSDPNGLLARQATIRQTSAEQFEEHKRKMLLAAQEEKIPVFPDEPKLEDVPERRDEDAVQMSATSYPGQEWNPYEFGYEDDEQ